MSKDKKADKSMSKGKDKEGGGKGDDERDSLLGFFQDIDWNRWVDDDEVKNKMIEIKTRIESSDDSAPKDLSNATRIKLVVVGDGAVGKTSLLISFQTKKFPASYVPTVFENYTAPMKHSDGSTILLHLWDTAGQEEYDRLRPLSYPNSDVVLLCFSTVNKASFEAIKIKWFPEVNHYIKTVPKLLVGTKVDLRDSGTQDPHASEYEPVSTSEGESMAKDIGASRYVEVSAKTRKNLTKVFETAVDCVMAAKGGGSLSVSSKEDTSSRGSSKPKPAPASKGRCVVV